ncbi:MAG TPA: ABC transporter permease [Candidatus Saccharimonadales bacterium]|nr:ABC transporter permease [Candidatus Saccharimonadales bacterium]
MNLRPIAIVYAKELRDLLRDRRTLISMVVVPVIVLPAIMISLSFAATKIVGQARQEIPKIMLLGGADSPRTVDALRALHAFQFVPSQADFTNLISDKKIRAALEIPPRFDEAVEKGEPAVIRIYTYAGEMKSVLAAETLEQVLRQKRETIVSRRMAERHVAKELLTPFSIEKTNVASPKKVSGNLIGMILPYMVIIMCLTGAIYPAVDLTAGEKERGTMETLLCSPVARTDLVAAKGLVVLTVSLATAFLSVSANGLAVVVFSKVTSHAAKNPLPPMTLDPSSLVAVCVVMAPLAIFLSAAMLAIGLFARGSKEANSYMQPMLILAIVPAVAAALPGVELNYGLAFIPILNVSLASKEILTGTFHWNYLAVVFFSMCAYAVAAAGAAVAMFKRETVLFRT